MTTIASLDPNNIQGDILFGLPKETETFVFFQIRNVALFKQHLKHFIPHIKTAAQVADDRKAIAEYKQLPPCEGPKTLLPLVGVNIAFSNFGLIALGLTDTTLTQDQPFKEGQKAGAVGPQGLGDKASGADPEVPDWDKEFQQDIHAVIFIAGDSHATVNKQLSKVYQIFHSGDKDASITEIRRVTGDLRPGEGAKHEHFGFLDGISNPTLKGFEAGCHSDPAPIKPGFILTGREGDRVTSRKSWEVDGSFLVFRYLIQLVPEFNDFLFLNPVDVPGLDLTREERSELLGARLVGRWKSGAPIQLAPFKDDPVLGKNLAKRNAFIFEPLVQDKCPFAAHIRKTVPRGDIADFDMNRMVRRGIPFGPELTSEEKTLHAKTHEKRGLLFVCYQSSIENAFKFVQQSWVNNPSFPPHSDGDPRPGVDALIGQGDDRVVSGLVPQNAQQSLKPNDFVIPRGGEYFFSPSISALKEKFTST